MTILVVVNNARAWPLDVQGTNVVSAREYLTDSSYGDMRVTRVFNLCDTYHYQSLGYYVSLLAEARGQKPSPRARTIEDLQSLNLVRLLTEDLDGLLQRALANHDDEALEFDIYFGEVVDQPNDVIGRQLFNLLQAPLLRAEFRRIDGHWIITAARAISVSEVAPQRHGAILDAARKYLSGDTYRNGKQTARSYDVAVLVDPEASQVPSNPAALAKFVEAAATLGMRAEFITRADYGRISQFDALFIRDTTQVNHYTYRFARQAAAEGLVVIDDPDSILKCSNKVYLAELLDQHDVPAPKTLVVYRDNIGQIIPTLGLPCILKQPDSAFSAGVVKVENAADLTEKASRLLDRSDLIIAQEYLPTEFDWRVGVLDRRALFVAKYYMAPGHWQVIKHEQSQALEGATTAFSVGEVPDEVIRRALDAANCIGDGLYGVDIKQSGDRCYVIEVNDNPNVDAGNEDAVLKDALYREIMGVFLKRIEARRRGRLR